LKNKQEIRRHFTGGDLGYHGNSNNQANTAAVNIAIHSTKTRISPQKISISSQKNTANSEKNTHSFRYGNTPVIFFEIITNLEI